MDLSLGFKRIRIKMNGDLMHIFPNISLFDAFTTSATTVTNRVAVEGGFEGGYTWRSWVAYPIVFLVLLIAALVAIRQNLDRVLAIVASLRQSLEPLMNLFKRDSGVEQDVEMADMAPAPSMVDALPGRNLSDSERIRAGARSERV